MEVSGGKSIKFTGRLVQLRRCADKKDSQIVVSCHSVSCPLRYNYNVTFNKEVASCFNSCFGDSSLPDGFTAINCMGKGVTLFDCGEPSVYSGDSQSLDGYRPGDNVGVICSKCKLHDQQSVILYLNIYR